MAVFTRILRDELQSWLTDYSVGTLIDFRGIESGIENTNYFVTTSEGEFVLTLFEVLKAQELPFYLNFMAHLANHGIPCPRPIANLQNQYLGELKSKTREFGEPARRHIGIETERDALRKGRQAAGEYAHGRKKLSALHG